MQYTLIKSRRKTISVELKGSEVIVRAPMRTTRSQADDFVVRYAEWIDRQRERQESRARAEAAVEPLTPPELDALYDRARAYLPDRAAYYADRMGVTYHRITVRCQRTRWGSCSAKHNLNFNCLLMLAPPEVIDAVVVHELCHLTEMNHSPRFYALVYAAYPDYDQWNGWLKEHGHLILARLPN